MTRLLLLVGLFLVVSACSNGEVEYLSTEYSLETIEYMEAACLRTVDMDLDEETIERLYDHETKDLKLFMENYSDVDWVVDYSIMLRESWQVFKSGEVDAAIQMCEEAVEFRKQYYEPPE